MKYATKNSVNLMGEVTVNQAISKNYNDSRRLFNFNGKKLLSRYDYGFTDYGMDRIWHTFFENKFEQGSIGAILSNHPDFNSKYLYLSKIVEFERVADIDRATMCIDWIFEKMFDLFFGQAMKKWQAVSIHRYPLSYSMRYREWFRDYMCTATTYEAACHLASLRNISRGLLTKNSISDELIYHVSALQNYGFMPDLKLNTNQSLNKVIGKICRAVGVDKIQILKTLYGADGNPRVDDNGNVRTKDYGYNHYITILSDAIKPKKYTMRMVVSVNPMDYWTMSFGWRWASCHTIDKENRRGNDHNYSGCYSSGTESYMLDNTSMIVYLLKTENNTQPFYNHDKIKRCVFCVGKDKIIQSRLYPDGRDGGEDGLAAQLRREVQKVILEAMNVNGKFYTQHGSSIIDDYVFSNGTHYRDYSEYDDCSISFLVREDDTVNNDYIYIGHDPICPVCGEEHYKEDNIICDNCIEDVEYCRWCNDRITRRDIDNGEALEINGEYYCCYDCATRDGYVNVRDEFGDWVWVKEDDNIFYDNYLDESVHVYYTENVIYVEEDAKCYISEENANADGYVYCSDGNYHAEENCTFDESEQEYIYMEKEDKCC